MNKIIAVCKTLFGTTIKKYPFFFVLEALKNLHIEIFG